jgi:hypothetical protein
VAAVAVTGSMLTACSGETPAPFRSEPPLAGSVIAARVIADDTAFDPDFAKRPRFVPCQGLSGCTRSSPTASEYYPGVTLPPNVDDQVDYSDQFVLYLAGAAFDAATLDQATIHVRLRERPKGFQMVKLTGQGVLGVPNPTFVFQNEAGGTICTSSWEGCG